ncbi:hypothetical protein UFOVP1339_59 [uncultured Caudovirales phage]|uniref:Uncharacterized protein n=1 Tax=uncultured Caudovirales phage TaxID=2100421 RepID=A0A6J5RTH7_9CAUD|nr:hypothetical protein UFOVP1339_59 [uncultured Caudovirales phage]
MIISIPTLPPVLAPLRPVLDTIRRAFAPLISRDEATPHILLLSPNGTTYTLTVSDAGVVATAVNDGKTRP